MCTKNEGSKHSCMGVKIPPLDRKWIAIWWEPTWKLTGQDGSCVCSLSPWDGHSSQRSYSCPGQGIWIVRPSNFKGVYDSSPTAHALRHPGLGRNSSFVRIGPGDTEHEPKGVPIQIGRKGGGGAFLVFLLVESMITFIQVEWTECQETCENECYEQHFRKYGQNLFHRKSRFNFCQEK